MAIEAVQKGEDTLLSALDQLPAAIYVTDPDGLITYYNPACINFAGRVPTVGSDRWCVTWKLYTDEGVFDLVCGRPYCNLSREPRLHYRDVPFEHSFAALKKASRLAGLVTLDAVADFNPGSVCTTVSSTICGSSIPTALPS